MPFPSSVAKFKLWNLQFNALKKRAHPEFRSGTHRVMFVAADDVVETISYTAFFPITSLEAKDPATKAAKYKKPLVFTVDFPRHLPGLTEDSLGLIFNVEAMDDGSFELLHKNGKFDDRSESYRGLPVTQDVQTMLSSTLFDPFGPPAGRYTVGAPGEQAFELQRGSIVELEAPSTPAGPRPSLWIVISSSIWLHFLQNLHRNFTKVDGVVRGVFHAVPIIPPALPGAFVVPVTSVPTPTGDGACLFYEVRTLTVRRIRAVHAPVDSACLQEIDNGLQLFLGLA